MVRSLMLKRWVDGATRKQIRYEEWHRENKKECKELWLVGGEWKLMKRLPLEECYKLMEEIGNGG